MMCTCVALTLQQIFGLGSNVEITQEGDTERHTFGIDIRMMHLSGKDIFSVWDFAGQVDTSLCTVQHVTCTCMHI